MKILETKFEIVHLLEPELFSDNRGFFFESYNMKTMAELGVQAEFIQDNHSFSKRAGTVRGMHFQSHPKAQTKLVRVIKGEIDNFIVDIRQNSPTFKQFCKFHLSAENKRQLYIPVGFANGFVTIVPDTEVVYKVDQYYSPECDRSFRFDDPEIGIEWNIDIPVLSKRDQYAPSFKDVENNFFYEKQS